MAGFSASHRLKNQEEYGPCLIHIHTKETKKYSFLDMILLLKNKTLKCALATRQSLRYFQHVPLEIFPFWRCLLMAPVLPILEFLPVLVLPQVRVTGPVSNNLQPRQAKIHRFCHLHLYYISYLIVKRIWRVVAYF